MRTIPTASLATAALAFVAAAPAAAQVTVTLEPIQDTHVVDAQPSTNFGTSETLRFGRGSFWGLGNTRTLVQFDYSSLPTDTSKIHSALFSAYQYATEPAAGGLTCDLWHADSAWFETLATWNSQPLLGSFSWSTALVGDSGTTGWIYWEAGTLVRSQIDGNLPDQGWIFKMTSETAGASRLGYFHSREYTANPDLRPRLEVGLYELVLTVPLLQAGQSATFTVDDAAPGATVYFALSTVGEGTTPVPSLGLDLNLDAPILAGAAVANSSGTATLTRTIPPGASGRTVWFQAAADGQLSRVTMTAVP